MEAIKALKERRSVRKYKADKVSQELLTEVIEISRWAPSWANTQIARYTLIQDKAIIKQIADSAVKGFSYNMKTLENAPGVAVLSYVVGKSGKLPADYGVESDNKEYTWEIFDAGIACNQFCLAAHAKGLGTCIFGVFDHDKVAELVDLPEGETVAAVITFGYENGDHAAPTPRKETETFVRFK